MTNAFGTNHHLLLLRRHCRRPALCVSPTRSSLAAPAGISTRRWRMTSAARISFPFSSPAPTVTGTCPKVYTRVWTIYDACVNSMTATQTCHGVDTVPPMLLCSGLNLFPNPGFEDTCQCANAPSYLEFAHPWFMPTIGSARLVESLCATLASGAWVPSELFRLTDTFRRAELRRWLCLFPGWRGNQLFA